LKNGIFDDASISVIASDTVHEIGRLSGRSLDVRRFRPNVVVRLLRYFLSRKMSGLAVCSRSAREATPLPLPPPCAISAARW
jgi:uncharacterized protein YcbX